jgi:hypothetical protein
MNWPPVAAMARRTEAQPGARAGADAAGASAERRRGGATVTPVRRERRRRRQRQPPGGGGEDGRSCLHKRLPASLLTDAREGDFPH